MPPVGPKDCQNVRLQIYKHTSKTWETISRSTIDELSRTAAFRIPNWDSSSDIPYRLTYKLTGPDGEDKDYYWKGTVRREPIDKKEIVVAAFTGNYGACCTMAFESNRWIRWLSGTDCSILCFPYCLCQFSSILTSC